MQILARSSKQHVRHGRADPLLRAFAATEYVVHARRGDIVVRIGHASPVLDRVLDGRSWTVITAYNPNGVSRPSNDNAAAQLELEQLLRESRPASMLPVSNHDPSGRWPDEPAWLVTCDQVFLLDELARRFGQLAVVTGRPGAPAALRIFSGSRDTGGIETVAIS